MPDRTGSDTYLLWGAYVPRWAHAPLSGEGAGRFGGRWNPVGAPTIYAACELSTAWAEYNQGFVQHPALIAHLRLSNASLADLVDDDVMNWLGIDNDIHECQWRMLLDRGDTPPTHILRERLLAENFDGVIFPSFMSRGGRCVALWRWNRTDAPVLSVVDPDNRLPKNPASWM